MYYSPFGVSLFSRHYARLKKTLSQLVNVFSKTNTLSEIFVHLSAIRWRFSAPFQAVKNSIFATFPVIFSACLVGRNFELFHRVTGSLPMLRISYFK